MSISWHVPALRGVLGDWVFYPALMSAEQISARVMSSKEIREVKHLDDYLQRDLNKRVEKIIRYLKSRDSRFFNAILLGVFDALPNWVDFKLGAVGQKLGIADVSVAEDSLGLLIFQGTEKIFALDGQHRTEAIRRGQTQFSERLKSDQYPVIFLAHVDDKAGKVRTRRLFCDINKNAVAVSEGDRVVIDEDDLCAVVTRRIYAEYPSFRNGAEIAVTEKKEQLTEDGQERFTSLLAIHTVCKRLKRLFKRPNGTVETAPDNVVALQSIVTNFWDFVIQHEPSLNRYFKHATTTPKAERIDNRNLAFRPIGLEILARLYAHCFTQKRLHVLQWALTSQRWENPGGLLEGIVWHHGRIESKSKAKSAAVDYCLYLLHELPDGNVPELLESLKAVTNPPWVSLPPRLSLPHP